MGLDLPTGLDRPARLDVATAAPARPGGAPEVWDRRGLPAWAYTSDELLELERAEIFRRHWLIVGHESELPEPGDFVTFDVLGERALVVRGKDEQLRAFHNVCRHRGSRVVAAERGRCKSAIVCPFHGWAYNLDGTLRGAAQPKTLPPLDPIAHGLKPIELEVWRGFVFVRFEPGPQPSVARFLARVDAEVAAYGIEDMIPAAPIEWGDVSPVNWKSVRDVDNEGYHVAMAHPGLHDLYGQTYFDEPFRDGVSRSFATFNDGPGRLWSVRAYKNLLPEASWLPESHRRAWVYIGIFPNQVLGLYPDSVNFYQELPLSADRSLLRGAIYRRREESRALRLSRYLSSRIDRLTAAEDQMLTVWSWEAAKSSGYDGVLLSDLEYGVKSFHDHLRALLPVLNMERPPARGEMAAVNAALREDRAT